MKINEREILQNLGIDNLNAMQESAMQSILEETNTLLLSPTGSGKTLGFLLPIFKLINAEAAGVQCLILTPSRELAQQIELVWKKMGTGYKVNVCYGGHPIATEINNLSQPPTLLIGTPGRIADHLDRKSVETDSIKILVLDEFDKSLEMGFHNEMEYILGRLPNLQKRVMASATARIAIPEFVQANPLNSLNFIEEAPVNYSLTLKTIMSEEKDKINTLFHLLCTVNSEAALIFCNFRESVERTSGLLNERGIASAYYHGGMEQEDRERVLIQFRNGSIKYLVATDLAARGLDIEAMKHVIHYQLPQKEEEFLHRNGRTARMYETGTAYLLLNQEEKQPAYLEKIVCEAHTLQPPFELPTPADFLTVYVSGGRKNKINKVDIVGFFLQKGGLEKQDVGLIEVKDFSSFVAVRENKVFPFLKTIRHEKMKGKKYKIELAR